MAKRKVKKAQYKPITKAVAAKVLEVVDAGLVQGVGYREPGRMCVEAAVCYAMGEPHTDRPRCVLPAVRDLKIKLNDNHWWTEGRKYSDTLEVNKLRSEGLRRLAIAQLGSARSFTSEQFNEALRKYWLSKQSPSVRKNYLQRHARRLAEFHKRRREDERLLMKALKYLRAGKHYYANVNFSNRKPEPEEFDAQSKIMSLIESQDDLKRVCEDMVKVLIKLGSPGTKYLYLTK